MGPERGPGRGPVAEVVVVTGCSTGIGHATALLLARRGYTVVATVRSDEAARELTDLGRGLPGRLHPRRFDVRDADAAAPLMVEAAALGPIRAVVNNAGVGLGGFAEHIREDELRDILETNFFGLWRLTMAALPYLKCTRRATIVQISSGGGRVALPLLSAYAASKHAVEGFSEALDHELRPRGVRVVLVEPGNCRTPIMVGANRRLVTRGSTRERQVVERLADRTTALVERHGNEPSVVAETVARAIEGRRPRLRYAVGTDARLLLAMRRFAPERPFHAAMRGVLKSSGYASDRPWGRRRAG